MMKNLGSADRMIRAFGGLVILGLILAGQVNGTVAIILGIVAVALIGTSAISWCPLYVPLKISTRSSKDSKK